MLKTAAWALVATAAMASAGLAAAEDPPTLAAGGACDQTTLIAARACAAEARSEHLLAQAACANESNAADREACLRVAGREAAEAEEDCEAQQAARAQLCQRVGQAPYDPPLRPADFSADITNPFFPLRPGTVFTYRGRDSVVTVRVTNRTTRIAGVICRVVRDTNVVDGEVEEDTFDYYAQDLRGNVWYFGERTAEFADGIPVSTDGSWLAGVDRAKPGIIMPAAPRVGSTHRQEFALGEAEDAASVLALGEQVRVPFGSFGNVVKTRDFTPLEPEVKENKYYARGVGLVLTIDLVTGEREELIGIRRE